MARSVRTAFLASLLLVDCQRATPSPFPPMDLNQPFKTHCVGRMLIDLPEEIRQYPDSLPGGYVKLFYGLDKNFRTVDVIVPEQRQPEVEPTLLREKFEQAVRERQDELRAKLNEKTKAPMLVSSRPVGENGVLIRRYESAQLGDVFVSELHLLADGIRYVVFGAAIYPIGGMYGEDGETAEVVESRLKNLAANTRAYINAESAGPGFCVDGVVLNDKHDDERGKFEFGSSFHKDVGFDIYTEALTEQDEGLHARAAERMAGAPAGFWAGFHTLRKGIRQVAGMQAEESLHDFTEQKVKQQLFVVETWRDLPAYEQPSMQMRMSTGGQLNTGEYVSTSLNNDDAVRLWDKIVNSIRVRPGAVGPSGKAMTKR
ncbi:hypothetical protein GNZ10_03485 [Ralstonia sp. 3N]|nr:hypothetical protein [Ralstonia sp. B265]NPT48762.1 hypothetical protein [Ralstonia sp. 3N]